MKIIEIRVKLSETALGWPNEDVNDAAEAIKDMIYTEEPTLAEDVIYEIVDNYQE